MKFQPGQRRQSRRPAARLPQQEDHRRGGAARREGQGDGRADHLSCRGRPPDGAAHVHGGSHAEGRRPAPGARTAARALRRRRGRGVRHRHRRVRPRHAVDARVQPHARRRRPDGAHHPSDPGLARARTRPARPQVGAPSEHAAAPVPDPMEPILAAIERGEDPFPDHPGWEEGRPKGEGLYSPVNSADQTIRGGAEATPDHGAADGASLHSPVNSDAEADTATDEPADDGAPDETEAGAGLYFPVNSGEAAGEEPTPGAAGAAPPSPAPRERRTDAAVDNELGTGDGAARVGAEIGSGLGDAEAVTIDAFGGKRDFIFRKVGHRILEVRTRVTPPLGPPGTGSPPAVHPAPAAPS
jgi:hypothetical protein